MSDISRVLFPCDEATSDAFRSAYTRFVTVDHRISFRQHSAGQDAFATFPWTRPVLHAIHGTLDQHADTRREHGPHLYDASEDGPLAARLYSGRQERTVSVLDMHRSSYRDRSVMATVRSMTGTVTTVPLAWLGFPDFATLPERFAPRAL